MKQPTVATVTPRSTTSRRTETTTPSPSRAKALGRLARHLLGVVVWCLLLASGAECSDEAGCPCADQPDAEPKVQRIVITSSPSPAAADEAIALAKLQENRKPDEALILGGLTNRVERKLQKAFPLALQRVREKAACQDLFTDLGADGIEMLSATIYRPAMTDRELEICAERGAVAFTSIGRPHTRLCGEFGRHAPQDAALVLIHEALHHAGLSEWPHDPDALKSTQINSLVLKSCRM